MPTITRSKAREINNYFSRITRSQARELNHEHTLVTEKSIKDLKDSFTEEEMQSILQLYTQPQKDDLVHNFHVAKEESNVSLFGYLIMLFIMSINIVEYTHILDSLFEGYLFVN